MRRLLFLGALVVSLGLSSAAAGAPGPVFTVVPASSPTPPLATAETPNVPADLVLPRSYLSRRESAGLPFPVLQSLWQRAGATYGIPWQVLGAINKVESNFGQNMGPSSAGAIGWMQFMPSTWERWGMDANGDGVSDPWNPDDAIFAAARYLAAAGGRTDLSRGIFAYNHAQWYVDEILDLARLYGKNGFDIPFTYDQNQVDVQAAETALATQKRLLARATLHESRLARRTQVMYTQAAAARLLSTRLALEKRAFQFDAKRVAASASVGAAKRKLNAAEQALEAAKASTFTSSFTPTGTGLFGAALYQGDYVFPVGGGPSVVSVGHTHHDYPAADIAAPEGSPLYALTDGFIVDAWHTPNGNCGIGLTMRGAGDSRLWTYCHMSYEEPGIQPGTAVSAGQPVGLVGSTGHSTGPHLHLQLQPAASYPQAEPWFNSFAGSGFRWQDAPTMAVGPVFEVVGGSAATPSDDPAVITFTAPRP